MRSISATSAVAFGPKIGGPKMLTVGAKLFGWFEVWALTSSIRAKSEASNSRILGDSHSQITSFGEWPLCGFSGKARIGALSPKRSAASERAKIKACASGWRRAIHERSRANSPGL